MTPINFTGSFIKNITIPKLATNGKITSEKVSLVKLDKNDKLDVETLAKTAYSWENIKSGFAPDIYCDALKTKNYPDVNQEHYLALTTQNKNFEMVEPNKILGLALYFEKKLLQMKSFGCSLILLQTTNRALAHIKKLAQH